MAKRSNPYSDDFIQQSKTHVGLKQFNNSEDRLKSIYEKTLHLLYQGAKKIPENDLLQCSDISSTKKKDKMKQLFISKNGVLLKIGNVHEEAKNKSLMQQHCTCNKPVANNCGYCEHPLCILCQHQCAICLQWYCAKCSLIQSERTEICVSCYI